MLLSLLLLLCLPRALAQFGNANVKWDSSNQPHVTTPESVPTREYSAPANGRRTSLNAQPVSTLTEILTGLKTECEACVTRTHYVSKIRSTCLALGPKALKEQLKLRGIRCSGCTQREHYLDKVLDTVHMSPAR